MIPDYKHKPLPFTFLLQLIKSEAGQKVHEEVQIFMPLFMRLVTIKDFKAAAVLERFTEYVNYVLTTQIIKSHKFMTNGKLLQDLGKSLIIFLSSF